jgi:hypothetical protein
VENLRVLCAPCNLSKGAKMPPRADVRTFEEPVADLAAVLGRHQPRSIDDLVELLATAARSGEVDATRSAALSLYRDPEFADSDLDRCIDAIDGSAELADLVTLLRLHDSDDRAAGLTALLDSNDDAVRLEAGVEWCAEGGIDADAALPILVEAASSSDRHLSDHAVVAAHIVPGAAGRSGIPAFDSLLDSPVLVWRCTAALVEAERMMDEAVDGAAIDADRYIELCEVALASPATDTACRAALLLARLWSNIDRDDAREWTQQYLEFASESDDEDVLDGVDDLRRSLTSS